MLSSAMPANAGTASGSTAFVGIQLAPIAAVRSEMNYDGQTGVAVQAVTAGGPADTSGIAPGDVIQQIDGRPVDSPAAAAAAIHAHEPGQTVHLHIWRAGSESSVAVQTTNVPQVGMLPRQQQEQPSPGSEPSQDDQAIESGNESGQKQDNSSGDDSQ
jgi:C-terminal processing protease CtpA/Prc